MELDEDFTIKDVQRKCFDCRQCSIGGKTIPDSEISCNVFSSMNVQSNIMVVGQSPGVKEVEVGIPFIGPAGSVFDKALMEIVGVDRSEIYVTNVVKCYAPNNRKPTIQEMNNCRDILDLEMKIVSPKVVVAIGTCAFKMLTGMSGIMKNSGKLVISPRYLVPVLALIHPSPYNLNDVSRKEMFFKSMKKLAEVLKI